MIKEDMQFIGIKDFYLRCEYIKLFYSGFTQNQKQQYKYYVYARPFLKDYFKDLIWEYLNEPISSPYYLSKIDLYSESRKSSI